MRNLPITRILFLGITNLFLFGFVVNGQVTDNPTVGLSNTPNTKVTKIEITPSATEVTVAYTKTENDDTTWIRFGSSIYIRPKGGTVQ